MSVQEQQDGFLDNLLKVAAAALLAELAKDIPKLAKLGVNGIAKIFHKHKEKIVEAATPVVPECPKGYYWDTTTNSCQPDIV